MSLEEELSKETLYQKYFKEKLSPNKIARALNKKGIKVSPETIRTRLIGYGYKLREKPEAIGIAMKQNYGSANI